MTTDHQPCAVPLEEQRDRILREYEEATLGGVWTNLIPRAVREYFDRRIAERDGPPMTTEAIYQEIRDCVNYRIEQEEKVANRARGLDYEQALARIEAYETILDDLDASEASTRRSHA